MYEHFDSKLSSERKSEERKRERERGAKQAAGTRKSGQLRQWPTGICIRVWYLYLLRHGEEEAVFCVM